MDRTLLLFFLAARPDWSSANSEPPGAKSSPRYLMGGPAAAGMPLDAALDDKEVETWWSKHGKGELDYSTFLDPAQCGAPRTSPRTGNCPGRAAHAIARVCLDISRKLSRISSKAPGSTYVVSAARGNRVRKHAN